MTPFQLHKSEWNGCQGCDLCKKRSKVIHLRGKIPADVLFVGEAPGPSENSLGYPFAGPAGHLLDKIVGEMPGSPQVAFTNLVGCIPLDDSHDKFVEPPEDSIEKCSPKLAELIKIVNPKLVIAVGKLPAKWLRKRRPAYGLGEVKIVDIIHPAAILRAGVESRGLMIQKAVLVLAEAFEELI